MRKTSVIWGLALMTCLAVSACGDGTSAVETRDRAAEAGTEAALDSRSAPTASQDVEAAAEKTVMTANRRESVDDKVQRLYERNGADFGARSAEDFLQQVTAFTTGSPVGVERVSRPNGDTLLYQASTNTFAVVARDGTPRTMFKPDDGATYWAEQKAAAPTFGQRRTAN